ncbi:MAG TPA: hypothetical protein VFV38_43210 [Ktedonobacteraceae bacterium]|nr:hypothetical protein [Ktedonobacteraceae bacterium]
MLPPHEALQACLNDVSRCLDTVASRARLPQKRDATALLYACTRLKALLPLLEKLPKQHEYLLRMQLQNLPDHLTRLENEAHLLLQQVRQQTRARLVDTLMLGGLAVVVCGSLVCLAVFGLCLFTGSALFPIVMLCLVSLASTMQVAFLGCWCVQDPGKSSALRILLEQQTAVEQQGRVLMRHLIDVQGELQSRAAGVSFL